MSMTSDLNRYIIQKQQTIHMQMSESGRSADGLMGTSLLVARSPVISTFQDLEEAARTSQKRPRYSFLETSEENVADEDGTDEYGQPAEKKRRLSIQQVKALEKNFELENKLVPERKLQLARELGLQPRQVAVWFQNRRARWKTKQLEKDYDILKAKYDMLEADLNSLVQEKEILQAQVVELSQKLHHEDEIMLKFDGRRILLDDSLKVSEISVKLERGFEAAIKSDIPSELKEETCMYSMSVSKTPHDAKEGSSSSDSDDSEILDVDTPKHRGTNEKTYSPIHHQTCSEILALGGLEAGLLQLGPEDGYGTRVHHPSVYQRGAVKLEDGVSTEENCNGFLSIHEEQAGVFSCWDWS